MEATRTWDAIMVGGGPAGSTCASVLIRNGIKTLLLDRAIVPRVKLCAGWVNTQIWDGLEMQAKDYPHVLSKNATVKGILMYPYTVRSG